MSLGQGLGLVGGIVGNLIFPGLGGAIGYAVGSMVGNLLDPTIIKGPELNDLKLQRAQYGSTLAYVWGRFRIAGFVDWIGNDGELVPHKQTSGGKGGPKIETTSYTGSWSVKYCKSTRRGTQAIVAIDKHWADGRIVTESDINPTVYIGNPEQLADSSIEADLGVGEVPANRFIGSEVYNEVQMAQFFNRLPNMEALIRTKEEQNGAIVQLARHDLVTGEFPDYPRLDEEWSIDWPNTQTLPAPPGATSTPMVYFEHGPYAHRMSYSGDAIVDGYEGTVKLVQDHTASGHVAAIGAAGSDIPYLMGVPNGSSVGTIGSYALNFDFCADAGVETGRFVKGWATTPDGETVIVITSDTNLSPTEHKWHKIVRGTMTAEGPVDGLISFGYGNFGDTSLSGVRAIVEPNGKYIWSFGTNAGFIGNPNPTLQNESVALFYIDTADNTLKQYDAGTGDPLDNYGNPAAASSTGGAIYCPGNGYCATVLGGGTEYALYTRLGGFADLTLAEILADLFELAGLTASQYDVTAAEDTLVHGFSVASTMQTRNAIESLRQAYFFDLVESDDGTDAFVKVVMRGGDSVVEIPDEDLGVRDDGGAPEALLQIVSHIQDAELPARVSVQYYDPDQDYQVGSQMAQRQAPTVDNVTKVDLPIAMTADEARAIAQRLLYLAWLERDTYAWKTSREYAYLEPTDVVTIQGRDLRITKKVEKPTGVVEWEGVPSAPFVATQVEDGGAPAEGSPPAVSAPLKVKTELVLLDIPHLYQNDPPFGFRAAMGPDGDGSWGGANLFKSLDDGVTWEQIASTNAADVIGGTVGALDDYVGSLTSVDEVSTVDVILTDPNAELSSINADALTNGGNLCAIRSGSTWELLQFRDATLIAPQTYTLTGFLRGRKSTDAAIGDHAAGDTFVLLPAIAVNAPESELNVALKYKAVTFGTSTGDEQTFTNTGRLHDSFYESEAGQLPVPGNPQTGTSYAVVESDRGRLITFNNASAVAVSIPAGFPDGWYCWFENIGAGTVTITPVTWTIDAGATSLALGTNQGCMFASTGSQWKTMRGIGGTPADGSITNAKLADMPAHTFKARKTNSTGVPEDVSVTDATALLDVMVGDSGSGGTKGLVPAPAAGDAAAQKFLKADGTYAVPTGTGAMTLIDSVVTSGSQSVVTFNSIPGSYRNLLIVWEARDTATGTTSSDVFMKVNNDGTGGNYTNRQFMSVANGSGSNGQTAAGANGFPVGNCPGTSGNSTAVGGGQVVIPNYAGTTFHKIAITDYAAYHSGGPTMLVGKMACIWKNTAAITRLDFTAGTTAFVDGSTFSLYGLA